MPNQPRKESAELTEARRRWRDLSDQYKREVGLATDPLKTIPERLALVSPKRHAQLIANINAARDAYHAALKQEGRPVPHRPKGE